ncbi:MAG TPA: nuclear transport factor 2 family protein [Steroidobacteraceae bacterium]|nr:nuclear transport factor 2 family protein [Steroidobacteraceae bacterium]
MSRTNERGDESRQHVAGMHADEPGAAEAEVRARMHEIAQAIRDKDLDALIALYAPEVVVFDVFPPLETRGAENYRHNFERWFSSARGPIYYELRDLQIATSGQLASAHCLSHVSLTRLNGHRLDYWVRLTTRFESRGGRWLVTHEHISMPARM